MTPTPEEREQIEGEIRALKSLLADTDYNSNKLIEDLVIAMKSATAVNFINKFVEWLKTATTDYGTVLTNRAEFREKINDLEDRLKDE